MGPPGVGTTCDDVGMNGADTGNTANVVEMDADAVGTGDNDAGTTCDDAGMTGDNIGSAVDKVKMNPDVPGMHAAGKPRNAEDVG